MTIFDLLMFIVGLSAGFWLAFWLLYEDRQQAVERVMPAVIHEETTRIVDEVIKQLPSDNRERAAKMAAIRERVAERKRRNNGS